MQKQSKKVVALCVADIHLSHKVPKIRGHLSEKEWYRVMRFYLEQLEDIRREYPVPILLAGDLFDHWNSPPQLINFALKYLPENIIAIPGQHDLTFHNYAERKKGAYWTLVEAGKIENLTPGYFRSASFWDFYVQGFPWGFELEPMEEVRETHKVKIGLIHSYCWIEGKSYEGADDKTFVSSYGRNAKGYDVLVFGDNHKGFVVKGNGVNVLNCGTFMIRKKDEIGYRPKVGVIYDDGSIGGIPFDTSIDTFIDDEVETEKTSFAPIKEFSDYLRTLEGKPFDLETSIKSYFAKNKVRKEVRVLLLQILEEASRGK